MQITTLPGMPTSSLFYLGVMTSSSYWWSHHHRRRRHRRHRRRQAGSHRRSLLLQPPHGTLDRCRNITQTTNGTEAGWRFQPNRKDINWCKVNRCNYYYCNFSTPTILAALYMCMLLCSVWAETKLRGAERQMMIKFNKYCCFSQDFFLLIQ